ncbi:hypothetical protein [Kitasatospora sp. NPDC088346]|uniref:hypothetical protein n=1 Tax=Kitasatospora sp. NPDC088346 TaxID=3364073 RepID=UPI003809DE54
MRTLIIGVLTVLVTTFAVSRFSPRLEARAVRIKAAWADRDTFTSHVLTVIGATARLCGTPVGDTPEPLRGRIMAERARWSMQVEESTIYLVDNAERYALTYPSPLNLPGLLVGASVRARGLWLSELPEDERAREVSEVYQLVHGIFLGTRRHRVRHLAENRQRLFALLNPIPSSDDSGEAVPAA